MTDIKIKKQRYADKENLKKLMKYCKATFASKDGSTSGGGTGGGSTSGDYYTKSEIDTKLNSKANKTTTLSGYGITDAYTKPQVDKKVSDLVNSAPETLATLNELASALGNDPNFATTIATQIGKKANSSDVYNKSETDTLLSDLAKVATTGSYNDLLDKPTSFNVDLSNYYTKEQIDKLTIYDLAPDGAEAHNSMWGGRDITAAFNNGTVSANIANGTFKDIFPGDYITKQVTISGTTYTVNWVVADCDYWINKGDTAMTAHHVAIVPQAPIFNANMNPTNTTEGGYMGSRMFKETIPACATGIVNAFGSEHILTFRDHLTRDLNTSAVSSGITVFTGAPNWNGEWHSQQCNLMSEAMVYGGPHCASSALDNIMATRQMSAFRLSEKAINYNRQSWWLRDVVSSVYFAVAGGGGYAYVGFGGYAGTDYASYVYSVRPFALLR